MRLAKKKSRPFEVSEHLENNEDIAAYITEAVNAIESREAVNGTLAIGLTDEITA